MQEPASPMPDQPDSSPPSSDILSISALTLMTRDMSRSVPFYLALGFEIRYGGVEASFTSFEFGSHYLNLVAQSGEGGWKGWGRVIIYVRDVDRFHERALARGLHADTEPHDASWGERYFHITDPDGHELSFAKPLA